MTFGEYIRAKRLGQNLTLRMFADVVGKSPTYISAIENDDTKVLDDSVLNIMSKSLCLTLEEEQRMRELAIYTNMEQNTQKNPESRVKNHSIIRIALRVAKDADATDEEWEDFMKRLEEKMDRGEL